VGLMVGFKGSELQAIKKGALSALGGLFNVSG